MSLELIVNVVQDRLVSELKTVGFTLARGRPLKMINKINDETEVFLHPGVFRDGLDVRINPVIGVEVGRALTARNIRITQAGKLNRSCAFEARIESILR